MAEHALTLDISIFGELLDLWVVSSPPQSSFNEAGRELNLFAPQMQIEIIVRMAD